MYRFNTTGFLLARFTSTYLNSSHGGGEVRRDGGEEVQPPPELSRNVVRLTCDSTAKGGICQVYLVGTPHFNPGIRYEKQQMYKQKSLEDVKAVVNIVKPQVVFLQLCSDRAPFHLETDLSNEVTNEPKVVSEDQVAFEEGKKYGATIILGDRPMEITLERYHRRWAEMPPWDFVKSLHSYALFLCSKALFEFCAKAIKNEELEDKILHLIHEQFMKCFPILKETCVDEIDQYMSAMLLKVASKHNTVVAVMRRDHLPGINKYWKQNIEVEEEPLVFWPPEKVNVEIF